MKATDPTPRQTHAQESAQPQTDPRTGSHPGPNTGGSSRKWGRVVLLASLLTFCVSIGVMAYRVRQFNQDKDPAFYNFLVQSRRDINVEGWPAFTLSDLEQDGEWFLVGTPEGTETQIRVPVREPPSPNLKTLAAYDEWFKVILVERLARDERGVVVQRPVSRRLVLVSRVPPEGFDPDTWGSVRKNEWTFEFVELIRTQDNDIELNRWTRRWPRSYRGERSLARRVEEYEQIAGDPDARQRADYLELQRAHELGSIEPIAEESLDWQLALHVLPKLTVPKYKFKNTAMSFDNLGLALPGAGFGVLGMVAGVALTLRPHEVTRWTDQERARTGTPPKKQTPTV